MTRPGPPRSPPPSGQAAENEFSQEELAELQSTLETDGYYAGDGAGLPWDVSL